MKKLEETTSVVNLKAPPIYRIFVSQLLVSITVGLLALVVYDVVAAYSALLGGIVSTIPNVYFARKAFRYRGARSTPEIVKSFYAGQSGKMIMTVVMFALIFSGVKPINELIVIVSYIITIVAGLTATAYLGLKTKK